VHGVVVGLSEATKQMSPKRVHQRFHIAEFSASDLNEKQKSGKGYILKFVGLFPYDCCCC
jgi:hypothetical protein